MAEIDNNNILEWVQSKKKIVSSFSSVAHNTIGIELTQEQTLIIKAKQEQLEEIETVIYEFMEEEDNKNGIKNDQS